MATLETTAAIRKILVNDAGVSALVSARVFPLLEANQKSPMPYVTYAQANAEHVHALSGPSGGAGYEIDVHVFAETYSSCKALAKAVRQALDGYTGTVTIGADSVVIEQCHLQTETESAIIPEDGSNKRKNIIQLEFSVFNKTDV